MVDNPPVRDPFLALVGRQAIGQQPLNPKNRLLLPEVAVLVHHGFVVNIGNCSIKFYIK
jgi:hypothetical protein